MITPIFMPMNYRSGHFDISSVHHPIILLVFVLLPILLTVLSFGLGILTYTLTYDLDNADTVMRIGLFFGAIATIGLVIFAITELISCI